MLRMSGRDILLSLAKSRRCRVGRRNMFGAQQSAGDPSALWTDSRARSSADRAETF